jgi:hypothetical protein
MNQEGAYKMYNDFDKKITNALYDIAAVSPSKNIGKAAIEIVSKKDRKVQLLKQKNLIRTIVISVCFILTISLGGITVFSEQIMESIRNIFMLEKKGDSYNITEKTASSYITSMNIGGIDVSQFSKEELEKKLEFDPFIPEKIGSYNKNRATVGITLVGLASDLLALDMDKVQAGLKDDDKFKDLEKYKAIKYLSVNFSPSGLLNQNEPRIILSMQKSINEEGQIPREKIDNFNYKGVNCSYAKYMKPDYQENLQGEDATKQPNGIIEFKKIIFKLDNVYYSVGYLNSCIEENLDYSKFDYEVVKQSVEDYIEQYLMR